LSEESSDEPQDLKEDEVVEEEQPDNNEEKVEE